MFNSFKYNKAFQHIIEQIRKTSIKGKLKPGNKPPSEKELVEKFKESNAALPERLRSLEV